MHRLVDIVALVLVLGFTRPQAGSSQTLSVAVASGPVFLPGSRGSADWQGLLWLGYQKEGVGARLEAMYTGVPGADLVAFTGNVVWTFRRHQAAAIQPYLVAGLGDYVKFSEERFGLNGGVGVRRRAGPVRLFAEIRYHWVTRHFDEGRNADTFVPISFGIMLGR